VGNSSALEVAVITITSEISVPVTSASVISEVTVTLVVADMLADVERPDIAVSGGVGVMALGPTRTTKDARGGGVSWLVRFPCVFIEQPVSSRRHRVSNAKLLAKWREVT
jgi:hypothetical protein